MKIIARKRDDILRDKAAYEADKAKRQEQHEKQDQAYKEAIHRTAAEVKSAIESVLGNHADEVQIRVDVWDSIEVHVDNGDDPFGPSALSWRWSVKLDRAGNVVKDSSSWSGLSAVTAEQIQDLRNTVSILEILNNIDWQTLLNTDVPSYEDYVTVQDTTYEKPDRNYDAELKEADIEDIVGDENAVVSIGEMFSDRFSSDVSYASVLKVTPKRINIRAFPEMYLERWKSGEDVGYDHAVSKDKFYQFVDTSKIVRR